MNRCPSPACPALPRLLVIPGLRDSGPAHWQTWLQQQQRDSLRVVQRDWEHADVDAWADRIEQTLTGAGVGDGAGPWIAVAHSFGCLALVRLLTRGSAHTAQLLAGLLVAPAEPDKFGIATRLTDQALPLPTTLIASENDPWMHADSVRRWAARWGSRVHSLGEAGHINAESGFGPLPIAQQWLLRQQQRWLSTQRGALPRRAAPRTATCGWQAPQGLAATAAESAQRPVGARP